MKNIIVSFAFVCLFAVSSCTTSKVSYLPPKEYPVNNRAVVDLNFEDTWYKLLKYLYIEHNLVAKLDKENGLITLELASIYNNLSKHVCDCGYKTLSKYDNKRGKNDTLLALADNRINISNKMNILVKKVTELQTSVEINAMFDYKVAYVLYHGTVYSIDDYYKLYFANLRSRIS